MHSGTLQNGEGDSKHWPDFYSILDSSPETDGEALRRSINTLYIKANEQSDHRELKTRFYNQVLTQKVLPQCRLILLNEQTRQAYNQQWYLHRDGVESALSYQDFIRGIARDANSTRTLLLSDEEISILPSVGSDVSTTSSQANTQPFKTPSVAVTATSSPATGGAAPAVPVAPKKGFPVAAAAVAGVLVVAFGGFALNASRKGGDSSAVAPPVSTTTNTSPTSAPNPATPAAPPLMKLNSMVGNPDFESGVISPWVTTNPSGFVETPPDNNGKSGSHVLTFWGAKACDATVTQTLKNLKPGTYTLRAWTRRGGGQTQAEMFVDDYGGPRKSVLFAPGWTWLNTTIYEIEVGRKGQCTIGFVVKAPGNKTANIDAVEFFKK